MGEKKKHHFKAVGADWDEIEEKARVRHRRGVRAILIIVIICAVAAIAYYILMQNMTYDDYVVTEEYARSDTSATHYLAFGEGYVTYSNDGAAYVSIDDTTIWNQGYEMENPMVLACQSYIAIADKQGETVYVLNEDGLQGEISVAMPISKIAVASQGTVAVLMVDSGTGYLSLFDKGGEQIAEGAVHVENTGTPMAIALSEDGKNLAVSIVDVSTGSAGTTINLYNFGAAGQNQIDNLVGSFTYSNTIVPEMVYADDGTLVAFAGNGVYTFEGSSSPTEGAQLMTGEEIQSIFYDGSYFGLVYSSSNADGDTSRIIHVYDTDCEEQTTIEADFSYESVGFLDNHEICLLNGNRVAIYTTGGLEKFDYEFDDEIRAVFHDGGFRKYVILGEGTTERIRFKLIPESDELDALFGTGETTGDDE